MSFVIASPESLAAAVTDLTGIGSALEAANLTAAGPTSSVLAAGADEVSAAIAAVLNGQAEGYQTLSSQLATFHDKIAQNLRLGAGAYASAEAANASPLQPVLDAINAPTQSLFGRGLIGNGTPGTAAHPDGGDGGLF